jgi:hypothetical protein
MHAILHDQSLPIRLPGLAELCEESIYEIGETGPPKSKKSLLFDRSHFDGRCDSRSNPPE